MPADAAKPLGAAQRLRQMFLTGLIIILPAIITIWLLGILFRIVETVSSPLLFELLRLARPELASDPAIASYAIPIVGVLLTAGLILLAGALATNFVGRRLLDAFERLMLRVPLVKGIYGSARQLLDAFSRKSGSFRRVVAVEYPRPGVWTIGFLTESGVELAHEGPARLKGVSLVFLPTSPNPTSGWLAVLPDESIVPLEMSIEEGLKLIVSGGLVRPGVPEARD